MNTRLLFVCAGVVAAVWPIWAQQPPKPVEVPLAPIECWWKTDRSAVRVGEPFSLTLTCAVLDTERVKVVVDESSLGPSALHLVPFEIVGGQRFRDIPNAPRRFFQYQYNLRLVGEEFFGREVTLPRLQITYRVQNSLQGGSALQGRESQYSLVPVPIRVLSLVPAGAADIRDTPGDTFGDVDARLFRSHVLLVAGGITLGLGVLLLLVALARAAMKRRATAVVRRPTVSPRAILGAVRRELADVEAARQASGWNSELAGRAAAALRLAGAVALARPVMQSPLDRDTPPSEGQVATRSLWQFAGRRPLALSAAVTAGASANGKPAREWDALREPLALFSAARYSRPGADGSNTNGLDETALDAALAEAGQAVRTLRLKQWLRLRRRAETPTHESGRPSWAR